ncbi:Eco57I restriction-modification methylase domain-containing protein [Methanosphaera sp.]
MSAPETVIELVEKFRRNEHIYKDSSQYDEENTKIEFINPFFEALGWDVTNKEQKAPQYKDVEFENTLRRSGSTTAPDYAFKIGREIKFFVEAKKPSVNLETDKGPAYQIRRYGWSAGLKLSILTDFETLAIYETTSKPDKTHNPKIARIAFYHYTEYVDKWSEISNLFSKTAVLQGIFDNYVENHQEIQKGTSSVDDEFLKLIEEWREKLAKNIATRNSTLNIDDLNYAVQLIIDRIIFLRISEDRGIERYGLLQKLLDKPNIYSNFCKICKRADQEYNSGLFHFTEEETNDITVDKYTLDLIIDDKIFKEIIKNLYYPNSPYEFSVLPLEILGQVYERFLGKTIRLTKGHHAKVEEKPEVKKMGGVYYTPTHVTKYIVKHTLGEYIKNKTPNEISKIKLLDPSCGSGSFLLQAYNYLLKYHLDYYSNLTKPPKNVIYTYKGNIYLTIKEKKRILLNNIYGVDIDPLAVEVTKLSLLLKVLEDQNKDQLEQQRTLIPERTLPNLKNNIKCGNSLISTDVYEKEYKTIDEPNMAHPFDYAKEFSDKGKFDIIIGNPPYVRQESIKDMKPYLKDHYNTYTGVADKYVYFFEKSLNLLKNKGYLGYICSDTYTRTKYGEKLRKKLSNETTILYYNECDKNTFKATVNTSIIILNKKKSKNNEIYVNSEYYLNQNELTQESWTIKPPEIINLKNKIINKGTKIKEIVGINIYRGITTGYNEAFIIDEKFKKELIKKDSNNKKIIKPILKGKNIQKFHIQNEHLYLLYIDWFNKINDYPFIKEYLSKHKEDLKLRPEVKKKKYPWYSLSRYASDYHEQFNKPKLIYAEIVKTPRFYYDFEQYYCLDTAFILTGDKINLKYLTAVLNCNILFWLIKLISTSLTKESVRYKKIFMEQLPIVDAPVDIQDKLGDIVLDIQELYKQLGCTNNPNTKKDLQQRIDTMEEQINRIVYELYNLTEDEIRIIEDDLT